MTLVTIGVPCYDHLKAEMAHSLIGALLQDFPYNLHLTIQRGTYIAEGREMCIREALRVKADYLIFVDTDIVFPIDGLRRLIEHGKDIVGADYPQKRLPLTSTVKLPDFDGKGLFYTGDAVLPDKPFLAAAVATGFMAINLQRLTETMAAPYFALDADGRPWRAGHGSTEGPGEDVAFCLRARQAGLEVWCDPTIQLGHIGEFIYAWPARRNGQGLTGPVRNASLKAL